MKKKKVDVEDQVTTFETAEELFELVGVKNPREHKLKLELAIEMKKIIKKKNLKQKEAAVILGIPASKVSDLVRGKVSQFTLDRIFRFFLALGKDVQISIKTHTKKTIPPSMYLVSPQTGKRLRTY